MSSTKTATTETFEDVVLKSDKPVLVDFWAAWCGPCLMVGPILEEIAAEHADKIDIVKVNVDEEGDLAMQYGITSIPNMKLFKGGEVVKTIIGAKPKVALINDLAEVLA